ncbi:ABC transporter ATP-binding protein [Shouchella clausii]
MEEIVRLHDVTKFIAGHEVVSNVTMSVRKGEIYGLLGPNGSGKTMIMKMLTNLVKPSYGTIDMFGEPIKVSSYQYLSRVGSMIEYPTFYEKKTAQQNLQLVSEYMGYYDPNAINEVLEWVELEQVQHKPVHTFSLGMKQRLGIARAMLVKPELLILDEPMNGLDPSGIKTVREMFQMMSQEYGTTLIVSSHLLSEVELFADRIGVIKNGKWLQEISMKALKEENTEYIEILTANQKQACFVLEDVLQLSNFKALHNNTIRVYETGHRQNEITQAMLDHHVEIEAISKKYKSLEEYFHQVLDKEKAQEEE